MLAELCMDAAEEASAGRGASFQPQQEKLHTSSAQVRFRHNLPTLFIPTPATTCSLCHRLAGKARHDSSMIGQLVHLS